MTSQRKGFLVPAGVTCGNPGWAGELRLRTHARTHARRLPFTAPPGSPHPRVPAPPVHCTPGPLHPWSTALPGPRLPAARAEGMRGPSYPRLQRQRGWAPRWTPSASETDVHPTGITPGLNVVRPLPESRPAAATLKEAPGGVFKVNAKRLLRILPSPRRVWSPIKSTFSFQEEVS